MGFFDTLKSRLGELQSRTATEVGKYKSKDFAKASMAMCALIAAADGTITADERRKTAGFIGSNLAIRLAPGSGEAFLAAICQGFDAAVAYGAGALVGIHGSWNRTPPRAPEVAFFPSTGSGLGDQQTLLTGFQSPDGDRWGRPVAAVQGPDGAVYVSDDSAGAVYRMQPPA